MSTNIHSDDGSVLDGEEFVQGKDLSLGATADGAGPAPEAALRQRNREKVVAPPPAYAMPSAEENAASTAAPSPEAALPEGCPPISSRAVLQRIREAVAPQLDAALEAEDQYSALLREACRYITPPDALAEIHARLARADDIAEFGRICAEHAVLTTSDTRIADAAKALLRRKWRESVFPKLEALRAATKLAFDEWHAELVAEKGAMRGRFGHLLGGRTDVPADAVAVEVRGLIDFFERRIADNRDARLGPSPSTLVRGALFGQ